jgi:DNA-directed RNA polymerase III subunit RPC3
MQVEDDRALGSGLVLNTKKPKAIVLVKAYLSMLAFVDNPTPAGKASSFVSLSGSKVYVEFEIIATRLRRRVLEAVTRERHGDDGVRVLRLLLDCGKVDEKQVCAYFDLILVYIESNVHRFQEVPKSADRNPTRMFYLWSASLSIRGVKSYDELV